MDLEKIASRKIIRSVLPVVVLLSGLVTVPWLYSSLTIGQKIQGSEIVDITAQQRLLLQQIALEYVWYIQLTDQAHKAKVKTRLHTLVSRFEHTHQYIISIITKSEQNNNLPNELHALYFEKIEGIHPLTQALIQQAHQLIEQSNQVTSLATFMPPESLSALLSKMNSAFRQFETQSRQHLKTRQHVEIILWVASLAIIIFIAFLVFKSLQRMAFFNVQRLSQLKRDNISIRRQATTTGLAKSEFLSNMSHELHTPISGMFGMLELLQNESDPNKRQQFIQQAQKAGHQLLNMINEILDIAKIEAKMLTYDEVDFDLVKLLDNCVSPFSLLAEKKGVAFSYHTQSTYPDFVTGDPMRLSQVLNNLLANALKFTQQGKVVITVNLHVIDKGYQLEASIRDTGIGIKSEDLNRIFGKFTQIDGQNTSALGGAGLGLTVANELTKGMAGKLRVTSVFTQGTSFELTLPLGNSTHCHKTEAVIDGNEAIKFAIVDDLESSRLYIAKILQAEGYQADTFASGSELLTQKDKIRHYTALIIDIHMPGLNGYELAQTLHAIYGKNSPPFLFISASAESINHSKLKFVEFWQGFSKPLDRNRFVDSIKLLVGKGVSHSVVKRPGKILLTEDEPINAEVVINMLKRMGHKVNHAKTGSEALKCAVSGDFDLILMDINLPDMSGIDATHLIRSQGVNVPIVALTANAGEEHQQRSKEAGMLYHLVKPVLYEELNKVIKQILIEPVKP